MKQKIQDILTGIVEQFKKDNLIPQDSNVRVIIENTKDKKNGDYDTRAIEYMITPEGEKIELNLYYSEAISGIWEQITKEQYKELLKKKINFFDYFYSLLLMNFTYFENLFKCYYLITKSFKSRYIDENNYRHQSDI